MNIIQIVSRVLLFGVVLPLCLVFYITLCDGFCPGFRFEISSYITDKNLQRLYIGMANKEVLQIVGAPFLRVDASYYDCDYYWQYTKNFMETGVVVRFGFSQENRLKFIHVLYNDITVLSKAKDKIYVDMSLYKKLIPKK